MLSRRLGVFFCLVVLPFAVAQAQTNAVAVLSLSSSITDAHLSGTASWHMGPDNSLGTITLKVRRDGKSRIDLQLPDEHRAEIRIWDASEPRLMMLAGGKWSEAALHNAWTDPNWFFPQFSCLATGTTLSYALTDYGKGKLRAQRTIFGVKPQATKTVQALSIVDYDVDPSTGLPNKARWLMHPDDDYGKSIPVEVFFSDYRQINGVNVPFKIQRYYNGTLQLDITISGAQFNTGLTDSDFTAQ